jgi:uncharacterized protein YciI
MVVTVLAVESAEQAGRLAREDDQAVAGGVLDVRIRPWKVVRSPGPGA